MNRKISLGVAIALMAIASAVTIAITVSLNMQNFNSRMQSLREREVRYDKISEIDKLVRQNFLGDVDEEAVLNAIAKGYVDGLDDPYAMYLTPAEYKQQMQDYSGQTADVGVSTVMDPSGYIKVIEVYPDSSADTAGIQKGDLIISVDGVDVTSENNVGLVSAMRGDAGTTIELVVRRETNDIDLEVVRRKVEIPQVVSDQYGDVGYLKIKAFNNNTPAQFDAQLKALLNNDVKALIFDVRGNPGGTIESVVAILDTLLPEGDLVSATYKDGHTEVLGYSDSKEVNLPMVVITNSGTASAAELFAQAIKDYNKGRTVGVQTYGKGVMQSIYPLSDGGALDITVAKYNPPKSPNFDGVGVKPDYEVKLTPELEKILYNLDEESDLQLRKAIELANAVIKTGGFDGLSERPDTTVDTEPAEDEEDLSDTASEESGTQEDASEEESSDKEDASDEEETSSKDAA